MGQSKLLAGFFGLAIHHISMDLRNPHIRAADKALNPLGKFGNPITKLSSNVFVMKAWKGAWKIATLITHQCYHPCSENIRGTLSKVASWILFSPCWIKSCSIEILPFFSFDSHNFFKHTSSKLSGRPSKRHPCVRDPWLQGTSTHARICTNTNFIFQSIRILTSDTAQPKIG